jgi:hypothetical protein
MLMSQVSIPFSRRVPVGMGHVGEHRSGMKCGREEMRRAALPRPGCEEASKTASNGWVL